MAVQGITSGLTGSEQSLPRIDQKNAADSGGYPFTIARMVVKESLQAQATVARLGTADGGDDPQLAGQVVDGEGYFGERQTMQRIVKFALAVAGTSAECLLEIQKGIRAGFAEIADEWGELLPVICIQTALAVTEQLEAWADNLGEAQRALAPGQLEGGRP